jgi:hydrogenase small subunit
MKTRIFTRRQFLKLSAGAAGALGLSTLPLGNKLLAQSTPAKKPAVIWLEAQDCAGCTESVFACLTPDLRDVLLDVICVRYHETVMAGTGSVAEGALDAAIAEGGYVLVVEGSIPAADQRYLMVGGQSLESTFVQAATNAAVILAVGSCAAFGGIPRVGIPQGKEVSYFLNQYGISKPYINLPGCPTHPTWFFDTVLDYLGGQTIRLDRHKRPKRHFDTKIHTNCPRRGNNSSKKFLADWNEASQQGFCLYNKGCRGKETYSDCPTLKWNDGVNWCIGNNAPCSGCTEPEFYDEFSPLYARGK